MTKQHIREGKQIVEEADTFERKENRISFPFNLKFCFVESTAAMFRAILNASGGWDSKSSNFTFRSAIF